MRNRIELPEGWSRTKLNSLGMIRTEKIDPSNYPDTEFELWSVPSFDARKPEYLKGKEIGSSKQIVREGDVLLCRINPRINRVWVVRKGNDLKQIASTEWVVLRTHKVRSDFLKHALSEPHFREVMCSNVSGVGGSLTRTRKTDLKSFEVGLPPTAEQQRIAERIDAIKSYSRKARETLERLPALIEEYRQSVLKAAFTGELTADWRAEHPDAEPAEQLLERILEERRAQWERDYRAKYEAKGKKPPSGWEKRYKEPEGMDSAGLPDIPPKWKWVRNGQISTVYGGITKNSSKKGDLMRLPYLRVANVYADELRLNDVKEIKFRESKLWKYLLEEGDLLVVEGNGSVDQIGRVAKWDGSIDPCVHQNHLIKVRPSITSVGDYMLHWMLSAAGRHFITQEARSTSGLYTLSLTKVRSIPIPLAPEEEQVEIVKRVRRRLERIDKLSEHIARAKHRLDSLDRSVLAKAFRGELVPTEAELAKQEGRDYEPASELLNGINGDEPADTSDAVASDTQLSLSL